MPGLNGFVHNIAPALDGSGDVYVGGDFTAYKGTPANRLVRLNSDGSIDTAFDIGTGFDVRVETIALDGSGDVYIGGSFADYDGTAVNRLVRLNEDGTVDSGFNIGAGFSIPGYSAHSIALAPDGSGDVYVGGLFGAYKGVPVSALVRLNGDGEIDTAFDTGAGFRSGFSTTVRSIAPALDGGGDLYVGGRFNAYNGAAVNRLVRLKNDGTLAAGVVVGAGFNDLVRSIAPMSDGDVYVVGFFTAYNGSDINRLVRLNGDGTVDAGFDIGTGPNGGVQSVASAPDGSGDVYVGGWFTTYNGTAFNRLVRLDSNGMVDVGFQHRDGL